MLILQLAAIIAVAFLLLVIHRGGVAHSLRVVGCFFLAAAESVDYGRRRFDGWMESVEERV